VTFDAQSFRNALARFASGVTVVTTRLDGTLHGLTVSAFSSLSLDPPLVIICVSRNIQSHDVISQSGVFAVNFLSEDQVELGRRFAGLIDGVVDRFEGIQCVPSPEDNPLIPGCLGWLDCKVWKTFDGGDHSIFVGEVVSAGTGSGDLPLLYFDRRWHGLRETGDEPDIL
jgi:Conserved protein/domain typically associated with flavoprotein oxygenases, DIM6/NTAB family